jgi:hypothetical protein
LDKPLYVKGYGVDECKMTDKISELMKVDLSDGRIDNLELRGSRESLATQRASGWEILYRHPVTTWRSYSAEE